MRERLHISESKKTLAIVMRPHQDLVREVVHGQEVGVEVLLPILPSGKIRVGPDRDQNQNLDQNLEADRNLGLDLDHKD